MHNKIIAVLPEEVQGKGICSTVYTETSTYIDHKTPELFLNNMYKQKGKTKKEMDKIIKRITQISKNTPYVIDASHVFFGFKHRTSIYDTHTRGFVNVRYVHHIQNSDIILTTGETITTISQYKSLNDNKNLALLMLYREIIGVYYDREADMRYIRGNLIFDQK